jgi:hypothetical protein
MNNKNYNEQYYYVGEDTEYIKPYLLGIILLPLDIPKAIFKILFIISSRKH